VRLAYFSPLPPKRTGIATYSAHLAVALQHHAELDFFDPAPAAAPLPGKAVLDYQARPGLLLTLPFYDALLYHFGNNPYYHVDMYRAFRSHPGVAVLHDTVLYYLIAGLGRGGMLREFLYNYGPERLAEFRAIEGDCPGGELLRYGAPERYPFLRRILTQAKAVIVHSETSAGLVRAEARCPVHVVPLLAYEPMLEPGDPSVRAAERRRLGLGPEELVIGCFGFIGPTKRLSAVFEAVARLRDHLPCRVLIVGEGQGLAEDIAASGIGDRVIELGFVEEARFGRLLRTIDILANLRFPSMGETSATLIQAMAGGIPSLVSDNAWFSELPDASVSKIPVGAGEADALEAALLALGRDEALRGRIARSARDYVATVCAPASVARLYAACLGETIRRDQPEM